MLSRGTIVRATEDLYFRSGVVPKGTRGVILYSDSILGVKFYWVKFKKFGKAGVAEERLAVI